MTETITINKIEFENIIESLSYLRKNSVTKQDMENYIETIEILSNPKTMKSIKKSREDIKMGRIKKVNSFDELLKETENV